MIAVVIVEGIAIVLLGVLVVGLLRGHAEVLRTLHEAGLGDPAQEAQATKPADLPFGVQPGTAVPRDNPTDGFDLAGQTPTGDAAAVQIAGSPDDTLVAFLSTGCLTCAHFWDAFADGVPLPNGARLVIVTKGEEQESLSAIQRLSPRGATVVMSTQAWDDYGIPMAPYFVYVDGPSGKVRGEGAASTWDQVDNLMRQGLADQDAQNAVAARRSIVPRTGNGAFRDARAEAELAAAGILPGDPSLYESPISLDEHDHDHTHRP
ncbi:MAG: hypothetical protein ACK5MT_18990 [Actinomycetales bacterium]